MTPPNGQRARRVDPPLVLDPQGLDDPPPLPPLSEGLDPQMLTYPFR